MNVRPTTIVIFGITGDLAQKKLLPAIYHLYVEGKLKNTKIVGFSRREFTKEEIEEFVKGVLPMENLDKSFLDLITYVQGQFDDKVSYEKLGMHLMDYCDKELGDCSNKLFYLSVPPTLYEMICTNISQSGLSIPCGGDDGFARILIEKPFGRDLSTAQKLDKLLGELFAEEQIYRIDHYLAKESLLKIIKEHRKDEEILHIWNKENIEKVLIEVFENDTIGTRGNFYDGIGAIRDVGQNHMLQMLALVCMTIPKELHSTEIQNARAEILENLIPASEKDIEEMKIGQYEGYLKEPGVTPESKTETLFSLRLSVSSGDLSNAPIFFKYGKALGEKKSGITIFLKNGKNIFIDSSSKEGRDAYQKVFLDCVSGDQTVFISTREIMAEWAFITPILEKVKDKSLIKYKIGTKPEDIF